ncbi:hypothetical protein PIB30_093229, partial [Stylosanthes scabra]|nr:hypothetical protein [Stylosanthes scabra]
MSAVVHANKSTLLLRKWVSPAFTSFNRFFAIIVTWLASGPICTLSSSLFVLFLPEIDPSDFGGLFVRLSTDEVSSLRFFTKELSTAYDCKLSIYVHSMLKWSRYLRRVSFGFLHNWIWVEIGLLTVCFGGKILHVSASSALSPSASGQSVESNMVYLE